MTVEKDLSVILLSGGLDSTVAFMCALDETNVALVLTFDYGQRAANREIEAAAAMSARFNVSHRVIALPWLKEMTKTALVDRGAKLPAIGREDLDGATGKTDASARAVWVPNRNGLFINIAAAYAESLGASRIYTGFNREEAATFPDNSPEFIAAVNGALRYSTLNRPEVASPTSSLDKRGIVNLGVKTGAPLELLWSCYEGGEWMCGSCESCQRLKRALEAEAPGVLETLFR